MPTGELKPFLISKNEAGELRLTVRETRRNSQGYPWVTSRLIDEVFSNIAAAKAYARAEFGAKAGEFASR